jgi:hypothetical protein
MRLEARWLEKAEPRLREVLLSAAEPEALRVLLTLAAPPEPEGIPPSPAEFPNRVEYRQALIERRERHLQRALGDTLRSLAVLGIRVVGGEVMRTVIADGTAEQVAEALGLSGVEKASLDQRVDLIQPGRTKAVRGAQGSQRDE